MTIDTTLPVSDVLRFRKICFILIKITLTDELKILEDKIIANQAQYDLSAEAAKISALPSKYLSEKYEYLTGEDLGFRPRALEKTKFEYSPLGISISKSSKKDEIQNIAKSISDFNHENRRFYKLFKGYDEIEEMSLVSKHNRIEEFNKLLTSFKDLRAKNPKTQLKKERIMKKSTSFTKSITMLTKMIMTLVMS